MVKKLNTLMMNIVPINKYFDIKNIIFIYKKGQIFGSIINSVGE